MRPDVSPFEIMRHAFWLGEEPLETNLRMQRIAQCIGELLPLIAQLSRAYGDRRVVWALTAIIVDLSLEAGDAEVGAAILRTNARLLEAEAGVDLYGCAPLSGLLGDRRTL